MTKTKIGGHNRFLRHLHLLTLLHGSVHNRSGITLEATGREICNLVQSSLYFEVLPSDKAHNPQRQQSQCSHGQSAVQKEMMVVGDGNSGWFVPLPSSAWALSRITCSGPIG